MAHFADIGLLVIAGIISAATVLRYGIIGYIFGVVCVWGLGIVRIELLYLIHPQRDAAILDAAWVAIIGWIVGVIWCTPFLMVRWLYHWTKSKSMKHEIVAEHGRME